MDWIRENWFWIVVGVLFIWMHTKMHGGHGGAGHGGGGGCGGHSHGRRQDEPGERKEESHAEHQTQGSGGNNPSASGREGHAEQ